MSELILTRAQVAALKTIADSPNGRAGTGAKTTGKFVSGTTAEALCKRGLVLIQEPACSGLLRIAMLTEKGQEVVRNLDQVKTKR